MKEKESKDDMIARIVAAYASRPDVDANAIVSLLARLKREVHGDGAAVELDDQPAVARAEPAIPIDQAVQRDKVYCLCCGKGFKMLKRHLGAEHGLTEAEYRTMFGLPEDMALVAPSYSKKKAEYAKEAGFGKHTRSGRRSAGKGARVS